MDFSSKKACFGRCLNVCRLVKRAISLPRSVFSLPRSAVAVPKMRLLGLFIGVAVAGSLSFSYQVGAFTRCVCRQLRERVLIEKVSGQVEWNCLFTYFSINIREKVRLCLFLLLIRYY